MGINISGCLEISHSDLADQYGGLRWERAVDLSVLLPSRDYVLYHSLFGIGDHTDFQPVAPGRGLPEDASACVSDDKERILSQAYFGHTWLTFQELQSIDWDESAVEGIAWEYSEGKATGDGITVRKEDPRRVLGTEFEERGSQWKFERITRRESLGEGGPLLCELMAALARQFGADCVRAIVWFG